MNPPWMAEVDVTAELATRLIALQFPALAGASVEPTGAGWDNAAFAVAARYVFRFPRRAIAAPLIARESAVLPRIAPLLPLAVPVPAFVGSPGEGYPWPFAGYRRVHGAPASEVDLDDSARTEAAVPLGAFLRALHAIDVAPFRARGLPGDEIGRLDHARRAPRNRERLAFLEERGLLDGADARAYAAALERDALAAGANRPTVLVHGDLYARHLLVGAGLRPCGVIDWGDVHAGDPALDIAIAWLYLPRSAHTAFRAAYGAIDDATWRLARYRALYHAATCAHYGVVEGDAGMLAIGLRALRTIGPGA